MVILSTAVRRRRQRIRAALLFFGWLAAGFVLLVITAYAAFETGAARNAEMVRRLQAEIEAAEDQKLELIATNATSGERVRRMAATLAELERDYQANVPDGVLSDLVSVIRERLSQGITPERLKFILSSAEAERSCDREIEYQPLLVRTPLSTALDNTVGFAKDRVVMSADGETLRLENGESTAFFDPQKTIAIRFLLISGEIERIQARLPAIHSVVVDDDEYQFQIRPDDRRGYLAVTVRRCDYP